MDFRIVCIADRTMVGPYGHFGHLPYNYYIKKVIELEPVGEEIEEE
jgi:hypothetical protein